MRRLKKVVLLLTSLAFVISLHINTSQATEHLEVLTENWPPFNYELDGELTGFGTEVIQATLDEADIAYAIRSGIWKGVYNRALSQKDILIYTIARIKQREHLFEWIGPIAARKQYFYKLKSRTDIHVNSLEDAKKYRIGTQDSDAIAQNLIAWGFDPASDNLQLFQKRVLAYRTLFAGRVDLITGQELVVKYQLELENLPYDAVEPIYEIDVEGAYYMAFKKGSTPKLVNKVRTAFERIKSSGKLERIVAKYK